MRLRIDVELDYGFPAAADVLLALEAAQLPDQVLVEDLLTIDGATGPLIPVAGEDGIGSIQAGALERANVDITEELVALISAQRNFQANAKAIETGNQMTQAIMNLRS